MDIPRRKPSGLRVLSFLGLFLAILLVSSCDPTTWVSIGYENFPDDDDTAPYVTYIWLRSGGTDYGLLRNFAYYLDTSVSGLDGSAVDFLWVYFYNVDAGTEVDLDIRHPDGSTILYSGKSTVLHDIGDSPYYIRLASADFSAPFTYDCASEFSVTVSIGGKKLLDTVW